MHIIITKIYKKEIITRIKGTWSRNSYKKIIYVWIRYKFKKQITRY